MFSLIAWPSSQYDGQLVPFAHFQAYLLFFFFPRQSCFTSHTNL